MSQELKGWYSGKYDSTKQRQVIIDQKSAVNQNAILQYTTSIRLEMLLCGMVVVTDAQWYDGLFFANMITEDNGKEFKDFLNFILRGFDNGMPPLNIRRRNKYMDMFKKPFLFSSIIDTELQEYILHIWDGGRYNSDEKCKNLDTFLGFIEERLRIDKNHLLDVFYQFKKAIKDLDDVDGRMFVPWGETPYIPIRIKEIKQTLNNKLDNSIKYLENVALSEQKAQEAYAIIDAIKIDLDEKYPNRSKIKENVEKLNQIITIDKFAYDFMHIFDNAYNLAIAEQHYCKYYDLYDACYNINEQHNDVHLNNVTFETQGIPLELLQHLGVMTWEDFSEILYDDKIVKQRQKWLEAFDSQNIADTEKQFSLYIDCLFKKIPDLPTKIIQNSLFYRTSGTRRFVKVTVNEVGQMVGGASSEEQLSSDEICLYFGGRFDETVQDKIVRYASTDDTNALFETVISPIRQAIKKHNQTYVTE